MLAIFKREFKSYFISPIGYVCLALFFLLEGYNFYTIYCYGYSEISYVFSSMFNIVLFIIPILTMRLLSEDKKQKVDQAFLTAPISLWSIAIGKFLAALTVFVIAFAPTLVYQMIFDAVAKPDWLVYLGNYVGIVLLGSALIAAGLFVSSLTESQVVAAVGSFAISFVIISIDGIAEMITNAKISKIVGWFSFSIRYNSFVAGTFDFTHLIFFLSFTAIFIFLTVRMLEKKRYS